VKVTLGFWIVSTHVELEFLYITFDRILDELSISTSESIVLDNPAFSREARQ